MTFGLPGVRGKAVRGGTLPEQVETVEVTEGELSVAVAEMHASAAAVAEETAVGALALLHPRTVAEGTEALLPDVHEMVGVDVALMVVGADAGAGRDGAVGQHGGDADACLAEEERVAHVALVVAQKPFAAVAGADAPVAAGVADEGHEAVELVGRELEVVVADGAPGGEDGEEAPVRQAQLHQPVAELRQAADVAAVDAGDHVEEEPFVGNHHLHGLHRPSEALGVAAHPVVVVLEAVEGDGGGVHAAAQEALEALRREHHAVGDHTPGEALVVDGTSALLEVGTHRGLPAREDDEDVVRIGARCYLVEHAQEVLLGHIPCACRHLTIASAMLAAEVAAQGALPEELPQGMLVDVPLLYLAHRLEGEHAPKRQSGSHYNFSI